MTPLFAEGGVMPRRTERLPTVREIIEVLMFPGTALRCIRIHRDAAPESLKEFWIGRLGVWLREDGSHYSGDRARGYVRPGWWDRWRLRRALRYNQRLVAVEMVVEP